ncbi:MAG: RidA family protein [Phycisphaerae bacterium]|nr:RidA family protein [Phycisphaerae bacterium]
MYEVDAHLKRLGIILPDVPTPVAAYVPYVMADHLVFVSGQLPSQDGHLRFVGKIPTAVSVESGQEAAKLALINALAVLHSACAGEWSKVDRVVRLGVFVQCGDDFTQQSTVANGASNLLLEIFGPAGRHARAAVGVNALPLGATVEVELVARLK